MLIVWKKTNGELAFTTVFETPDGFDVAAYADQLKANGDIPADWVAVSLDFQDVIPDSRMEALRWKSGKVVIDAAALKKLSVPMQVSRRQLILALHQSGMLAAIKSYVASASVEVQISWDESLDFERNNALLLAASSALGKSEADLDDLFILAGSK